MNVNVGYMSDPSELPGLAHFCEHMLFLGTKPYPNEGDFETFVGAAGGSNNAYTAAEGERWPAQRDSAMRGPVRGPPGALPTSRARRRCASSPLPGALADLARAAAATPHSSPHADTCYFFDVRPSALDGALRRFSQFFQTPLFTETATAREVNAIESEHEKNLQADFWRLDQLIKLRADPAHPYAKFGTGNAKSLKGGD
eukprot:6090355-Prymnesium_polylepis.1